MKNQKKQSDKKDGIDQVAAAVTVAVVGAGIAMAGAATLKDKENRDKVKEVLTKVKDYTIGRMEDVQSQAQDKVAEAKNNLDNGLKDVKKVTTSAKRQLHQQSSAVYDVS